MWGDNMFEDYKSMDEYIEDSLETYKGADLSEVTDMNVLEDALGIYFGEKFSEKLSYIKRNVPDSYQEFVSELLGTTTTTKTYQKIPPKVLLGLMNLHAALREKK